MTAQAIEAGPDAWRALDRDTRRSIRRAAASGESAPTEREAIAAVAWSRWWRDRHPYQMIMFFGTVLVAACAEFVERAEPGIERLALGALGSVIAITAFRLAVKRRRLAILASSNYGLATEHAPDHLPDAVTLSRPRLWYVTQTLYSGSFLFWLICSLIALGEPNSAFRDHRIPLAIFMVVAALSSITVIYEEFQTPHTVTVGPAGIMVPWWGVTVAWPAVRLVEVAYRRGEWRAVWYVERGSMRTTKRWPGSARFTSMTKLEIVSEEPDVAVWLTRHHIRETALRSRENRRMANLLRRRHAQLLG